MSDQLPRGWTKVGLRDLVGDGVFADGDWVESKDQDPSGAIRLIQLADVGVGRFVDKSSRFLTEEKAEKLGCTYLAPGDVLVSRMADPIGRACVFPGTSRRCVTVVDVCIVRPGRARADPKWLTGAINSPQFRRGVELAASGTTRSRVSRSNLGALELPVPPINEQRRIVAKLEALQSRSRRAREALEAVPTLLEKLRQSILAAAFRGDLTKDWRAKHKDVEPASVLLARIRAERRKKWEEAEFAKMRAKGKAPGDDRWKGKYREPEAVDASGLPELPKGWCWASVDDLSELQLGQQRAPVHAAAKETHPYVRTANITWRGLDLSDVKRMGFPDLERYLLRPGDVLLSEASGSPTEVGKPAIWRGEIPGCCYQKTLLRARPVSGSVSSEWLYLSFLADALLGRFARMAPGVGILHLTADRMLSWPVAIAPNEEQPRLLEVTVAALAAADQQEGPMNEVLARVDGLERAILAKSFRGKLVLQDPADEPAEAM